MQKSGSEQGEVEKAKRAVYALFFAFGIAYISFLSRLVKITQLLGVNSAKTGIMLLCVAVGSVTCAPIAGALIDRFSIRRFVRIFSIMQPLMILAVGLFATMGNYFAVLLCCPVFGLSASTFNVANNMAAVAVERRLQKAIMPKFHGMFCVGAVFASAVSTVFANFELPILLHFSVVFIVVISISQICAFKIFRTHKFGPPQNEEENGANLHAEKLADQTKQNSTKIAKSAQKPAQDAKPKIDLNLILIGTIVLASTFCEGSGNDWIPLGVSSLGVREEIAITPLWVFLCFQMIMRFVGAKFVDRFGEVAMIRVSFVSAASGVILFAFAPIFPLIYLATSLWGFGVALGYPLGISAAAKNHDNAAFRASVVASIGTAMNIAGPPMIGFVSATFGIRHALLLTTIPLFVGLFTCRAFRK